MLYYIFFMYANCLKFSFRMDLDIVYCMRLLNRLYLFFFKIDLGLLGLWTLHYTYTNGYEIHANFYYELNNSFLLLFFICMKMFNFLCIVNYKKVEGYSNNYWNYYVIGRMKWLTRYWFSVLNLHMYQILISYILNLYRNW